MARKIKALRWGRERPSSCAQEAMFSASKPVAPASEVTNHVADRKKNLFSIGKFLKLMKVLKKDTVQE